jgi:nitrous oxide reductase accessory protein NosL
MKVMAVMAAVAAMSVAGCGATAEGPPEILVDRTPCAHCGMFISEPVYAAAYRAPGSESRVFDDIGCLLASARKETAPAALTFWFHDAGTADWIDGRDAVLVRAATIRTPMGGGLIAFRDRTAAADAAARHQGVMVGSIGNLLKGDGLPAGPDPQK